MTARPPDAPTRPTRHPAVDAAIAGSGIALAVAAFVVALLLVRTATEPPAGVFFHAAATPIAQQSSSVALYSSAMETPTLSAVEQAVIVLAKDLAPTPVPTDDPAILTPYPTPVVCEALHGTPSPTGLCAWATAVPTLGPTATPWPLCSTPAPGERCRPANSLAVVPPTEAPTVSAPAATGHYQGLH